MGKRMQLERPPAGRSHPGTLVDEGTTSTFAIVGGTGAYRQVRGEESSKLGPSEGPHEVTAKLILNPWARGRRTPRKASGDPRNTAKCLEEGFMLPHGTRHFTSWPGGNRRLCAPRDARTIADMTEASSRVTMRRDAAHSSRCPPPGRSTCGSTANCCRADGWPP
jgi:hypothetical protein